MYMYGCRPWFRRQDFFMLPLCWHLCSFAVLTGLHLFSGRLAVAPSGGAGSKQASSNKPVLGNGHANNAATGGGNHSTNGLAGLVSPSPGLSQRRYAPMPSPVTVPIASMSGNSNGNDAHIPLATPPPVALSLPLNAMASNPVPSSSFINGAASNGNATTLYGGNSKRLTMVGNPLMVPGHGFDRRRSSGSVGGDISSGGGAAAAGNGHHIHNSAPSSAASSPVPSSLPALSPLLSNPVRQSFA
jgi:hypothetical protein